MAPQPNTPAAAALEASIREAFAANGGQLDVDDVVAAFDAAWASAGAAGAKPSREAIEDRASWGGVYLEDALDLVRAACDGGVEAAAGGVDAAAADIEAAQTATLEVDAAADAAQPERAAAPAPDATPPAPAGDAAPDASDAAPAPRGGAGPPALDDTPEARRKALAETEAYVAREVDDAGGQMEASALVEVFELVRAHRLPGFVVPALDAVEASASWGGVYTEDALALLREGWS